MRGFRRSCVPLDRGVAQMNKSMGSVVVSAIAAALLAGAAMPAEASTWRLDFDSIAGTGDGRDGVSFNGKPQAFHGRIIDDEYAAGIPGINLTDGSSPHPTVNLDAYDSAIGFGSTSGTNFGVTISATNSMATDPGDHNLAVLFNTNLTGTRDRDMEDDFDAGPDGTGLIHPQIASITAHRPGHVLMIQEHYVGDCSDGKRCVNSGDTGKADDEGARPAGEIVFEFDELVNVHSLDFFDVENPEAGPPPQILGFQDDGDDIADFMVAVPETGGEVGSNCGTGSAEHQCETHFNRVTFNFTNINRLVVEMGGSGGIDNLYGSRDMTTQIPEPGPLAVFATGFLALVVARRRLKTA